MSGWIKVSRDIQSHWIWTDPIKLKWWLDILMTVNYEDKKVPIKFKMFECKKGESLISLKNWGDKWGVSKTVVNNFFNMLENDGMIKTVNETVTTRLIVCNYERYQQNENANETQTKRKKTEQSTTKEGKEIKEVKEINISFVDFWNLYDKKVGDKEKLEKKWDSFTDETRILIMNHIPKYKLSQPDKKYRKDPSTYFNNNSWGDEIIDRCQSSYNQQQTLPSDAELTYENYLNELHNIDDRLFGPARGAVVYPLREKYRVAIAKHEEEEKRKRNY